MSRFLIVTLPLPGHTYPAAAVAGAVRARGHEVAWVGPESVLRPFLEPDARVYPTRMRPYRGQRDLGAQALKTKWEGFLVPYARFLLPAVERAAHDFRPDVMLVDQHAFAGALVAHRNGLRWASLAQGAMELTRPFQHQPKVDGWMRGHLAKLWSAADLPGEPAVDLRFSPYLVVALTTTALTGPVRFPDHFALVGPAVGDRSTNGEFRWQDLDPDRRRVLVTMGTLADDVSTGFYSRAVEALASLSDRAQGIVLAPAGQVPDPPAGMLVRSRAPVPELMPTLDAVVCHGGQNTVCEALAHAVPLVVAPIRHDQPVIAGQVAAAGAGLRARFHRVRPYQLREAVTAVLDDPAYRSAAKRISASFAAAGGAPAAAERLAALASRS